MDHMEKIALKAGQLAALAEAADMLGFEGQNTELVHELLELLADDAAALLADAEVSNVVDAYLAKAAASAAVAMARDDEASEDLPPMILNVLRAFVGMKKSLQEKAWGAVG